ncbi:MAG: hypothetical protein R3D34_00935 [Nitratireductor sp.]
MKDQNSATIYTAFNALGVVTAYVMLALSIHLAPVDLSTKGYWGMGIFLLTLSLVNFVKYRMDERIQSDRISQLEAAKNEKLIEDFVREK